MLQKLLKNSSTTSKTLMNLQTSQTWMKHHVTLLFLVPQPLKKKSTEGQSQDHKCQASLFHCSFNSSRKKQKLCFLLFTSLHHGYLKIWRMFLEVNIPLECKFLVPRVEKEKIHNERNLCESHLEEKVRWVFQHREVYSVNGFCQKLSWPWNWTSIFCCKLQRKDYPWHTDTVIAVSRYSRKHWDTRYTRE